MFFNRKVTSKKPSVKLSLESSISVNLIDSIHINLHSSFVRPDGLFFIRALGRIDDPEQVKEIINVYAENNQRNYLIEIEAIDGNFKRVALYQNVLTLAPSEHEWDDLLKEMASREISLDEVSYDRMLGGSSKQADLCEVLEHVEMPHEQFDCENRLMLFQRKIEPMGFIEKLKVVAEIIPSKQQASASFYLGFDLHPSAVTLLGN